MSLDLFGPQFLDLKYEDSMTSKILFRLEEFTIPLKSGFLFLWGGGDIPVKPPRVCCR